MEDLISVIVPVYNVEKYLNRCIDSIINQTYKNLEIILVDDGSPDNCGKICDEYAKKDSRIKVIHKENGGLSDARNVGINIARGTYVGFVDSDDWIEEEMYEILYNNILKYNADLSTCNFIRTAKNVKKSYNKGNIIKIYTRGEYLKKFFKIGTQECVYYAWNKLYRRELLSKEQYPVGLTSEDVEGTFKYLLKCEKVVTTKKICYNYFYNEKSITESNFSDKDLDLIKIWDDVLKISKKSGNHEYIQMAILNRKRINFTLLFRMAKQLDRVEINSKYKNEKEKLIKDLKKDRKILLKANIPISRKIMVIFISTNFDFINLIFKITRKGSKKGEKNI